MMETKQGTDQCGSGSGPAGDGAKTRVPGAGAGEAAPHRSTFIIFGSPRSGTTLLSTSLDLHPQIVVPDETDFIIPMAFILHRVTNQRLGRKLIRKLIVGTARFPYSLGEYVSSWDIRRAVGRAEYDLGSMLDSIYSMVARRAGKRLGGDKSPNDLGYLGILLEQRLQSSGIRIIHLVRDVRDVVLSQQHTTWAPAGGRSASLPWQNSNLGLVKRFGENPNYHRLRYEDLVLQPRQELQRVCEFLGVAFQEQMLDHTQRGMRYRNVEHHQNIAQPFRPDRIGTWRKEMAPEVRREVEQAAGEALRYFGYMDEEPAAAPEGPATASAAAEKP